MADLFHILRTEKREAFEECLELMNIPQKRPRILVRYVRDFLSRKPIGVMVGVKMYDEIIFGYAFCNVSKENFNKKRGKLIALGRAIVGSDTSIPKRYLHVPVSPHLIVEQNLQKVFPEMFAAFQDKCKRYFGVDN